MNGPAVRKTLNKGVVRRVLLLLFVATSIPMLFTAGLAFYEFDRSSELGTANSLKGSAKHYGTQILSRIGHASEKSAEIVRQIEEHGPASGILDAYLLSNFDAVWIVGSPKNERISVAGSRRATLITKKHLEGLTTNSPRLILTPEQRFILLRQLTLSGRENSVVAFQLSQESIWGDRQELPFDAEYCVFSSSGTRLYCTTEMATSVHSELVSSAASNRSNIFGTVFHRGETHHAALWQLFLAGAFGAEAVDIIAVQPSVIAAKNGADLRRVFIPAIALVLVLVAVLSSKVISRSLGPLRDLTNAARQIANGNLESRVDVRTGDEFEWLGDAFNNMADRIGHQIATLEAMSGIDRLILTGAKLEGVSEDVVTHLANFTNCDAAAVISLDVDAPDIGRMISSHADKMHYDRITLPADIAYDWRQVQELALVDVDQHATPYAERFNEFEQKYVVTVPVVLQDDLKGILLLGFAEKWDMSKDAMRRIADLAGRFAVALASVEREEALYRQAHYDVLTGLPNRQLLKDRLKQNLATARLDGHSGAILFLDLDRFKEVNDVYGHSVGDDVLKQTSERIRTVVRERDTVARLGGDEFVVVLPSVRNDSIVRSTAERLLSSLGEAFTVSGTDHYLGASIGITLFPEDGATVETLLKNSDAAMYRAKDAGRGRFEFFSKQLNAESRRKIGIERDLRTACRNGELEVHYQPQFDISNEKMSGAEALLRWTHPDRGEFFPAEFVPIAEESDLILEIGSWVVEQACKDLRDLLDNGLHPGPLSVNVSGRQLADVAFTRAVMEPIRRFGIHPGFVQLEVTETVVAQNRDKAIDILESLREEGVRVAIDDFGTGYSSLSYLQQMPFDVIKIDKSFIDRIGSGEASDNICRTIIKMAEQLGKKSIAEGVEKQSQVDFLKRNGCDFVQGYFYSRALPIHEFEEFIGELGFHTQRRKALEII